MANWKTDGTVVGTVAIRDLPTAVADTGNGGEKGLVPAPHAGDAANGKFLAADMTWTAPTAIPRSFVFSQESAATVWTIPHNLGRFPVIRVFTAGGHEVDADIINLSVNVAQVNFSAALGGSAVCV
jgi:hypothetical protein